MTPEELLSLLGWIPQDDWQRREVDDLVRALAVSDNAVELRRWFRRPQASLGRRTPLEALRLAKRPDDDLVVELRRLAVEAYR